jgi:dihydroorotate dehydrogenase (NAD+) catalytic subunit
MCWQDAVEFMIVGASAVQLGTVNFINPNAGVEIVNGLSDYLTKMSIDKASALTGTFII